MAQQTSLDPLWQKVDTIWAEYARTHDLSGQGRLAVGVDPATGEVFLGESAKAIIAKLDAEGRPRRLYFRWSDDPYYTHKGARR